MSRPRVLFVTIVPSPYQRDLFHALASYEDLQLSVYYMESASPDSPWPKTRLETYDRVLPGFGMPVFGTRWHVNWALPDIASFDFVILSSFTSLTGQWLMRFRLTGQPWLFWGERLRQQTNLLKRFVQKKLAAPLAKATGIVGVG